MVLALLSSSAKNDCLSHLTGIAFPNVGTYEKPAQSSSLISLSLLHLVKKAFKLLKNFHSFQSASAVVGGSNFRNHFPLNLHKFPFSPRILILLSFGVCTTLNVYDSASSISAPENVDNKQSSPKETIKPREKAELFH